MKAMVQSGRIRPIGHFALWLRDMLCYAVTGTPLEGTYPDAQEWLCLDMSTPPEIPRGVVYSKQHPLTAAGEPDAIAARPATRTAGLRHSQELTSKWLEHVQGSRIARSLKSTTVSKLALTALAANPAITPQ